MCFNFIFTFLIIWYLKCSLLTIKMSLVVIPWTRWFVFYLLFHNFVQSLSQKHKHTNSYAHSRTESVIVCLCTCLSVRMSRNKILIIFTYFGDKLVSICQVPLQTQSLLYCWLSRHVDVLSFFRIISLSVKLKHVWDIVLLFMIYISKCIKV